MGHPAPRELLPVLHRRPADRQEHLHLPLVVEVAFGDVVARLEHPVGVEVGGHIDPLLLHPEHQIVKLVELPDGKGQRIFRLPVQKFRVVVVNPHGVVAAVDEIIGELIHRRLRQETCGEAEIRPVEPDLFLRRLLECERSLRRRPDETVLSGWSVGEEGEIECTAAVDFPLECKRLPLVILLQHHRLVADRGKAGLPVGKGHAGDHPDRFRRRRLEAQQFRPGLRQCKTGSVKSDKGFRILRAPHDRRIFPPERIPPVAAIGAGNYRNADRRAIRILHDQCAERRPVLRRPGGGMQQIDRSGAVFRQLQRDGGGGKSALFPGEHESGTAAVLRRVKHLEREGARPDRAGFQFPQIVFRPLISPAAFPVSSDLIGEVHVCRLLQADRLDRDRNNPEREGKFRLTDFPAARFCAETERERLILKFPIILNRQPERIPRYLHLISTGDREAELFCIRLVE